MPTGIYERKFGINYAMMGKRHSNITKIRMSIVKKGKVSPRKGVTLSDEIKEKISHSKKGQNSGENCNFWKGGITTYERKLYLNANRRAKKAGLKGYHTQKEWEELKEKYNFMCLCCKRFEPDIKLTRDHIIPVSANGTDFIDNIQPLCKSCNSIKYNKDINYRRKYV